MDMAVIGKRISEQRKKLGLTQEQLAEAIGVTPQAVSKWENGHNLPDIDNLFVIAEVLKIPYSVLVDETKFDVEISFRNRLFHEDNMYTRVKTTVQLENMSNSLKALDFMREKHEGQFRKGSKFATEEVKYINHPLIMACHAFALGIKDDEIIAAILLHDVLEDTDTLKSELPVSDEIKDIVELLTFEKLENCTKEESKAVYYDKIKTNKKACLVKAIDRCNNVSTMAGCFGREKLVQYIGETEEYIIPILDIIKYKYPEYSNAAFIIKYQIISLLESIKSLL